MTPSSDSDSAFFVEKHDVRAKAAYLRGTVHNWLSGERPADPRDVEELLVLLLAYALSYEYVICMSSGGLKAIPGHGKSVEGYAGEVLRAQDREHAFGRLVTYLEDAQKQLFRVAVPADMKLDALAEQIAAVFRAEEIEHATKPSMFQRLLGCAGAAYWKEYRIRFGSLSATRLRELAEKQGSNGVAH